MKKLYESKYDLHRQNNDTIQNVFKNFIVKRIYEFSNSQVINKKRSGSQTIDQKKMVGLFSKTFSCKINMILVLQKHTIVWPSHLMRLKKKIEL